MLEINKNYSREFIHSVCGGGKQAFLPTKNGKVVAACLRTDLNPRAPDVIVCDAAMQREQPGERSQDRPMLSRYSSKSKRTRFVISVCSPWANH
jgi:hypothetical protein